MIIDKYDNGHLYATENIKWTKNLTQNFFVNYNKYNYYTKILNGLGDDPGVEITDEHLKIAKNNLLKFAKIFYNNNS